MATNFDLAVALAVAILVGYFGYNYMKGDTITDEGFAFGASAGGDGDSQRNIVSVMENQNKNVVVFFGSQTGTAEDCARKLAKDLSVRFGFRSMVADLENYDFENLAEFNSKNMAFFCVATYGEGEPTDNAVDFFQYITDDEFDADLRSLNYCVFGLGNSTYDMFNEAGRRVNKSLEKHGAHQIAPYGEGDDGKDSMEDDFVTWKEQLFAVLRANGLVEREYEYEPSLSLESSTSSDQPYLGEQNANILAGKFRLPFHHTNPLFATVKNTTELCKGGVRSCIRTDFDLTGTGLRYTTGDHLAFWPQNANAEVDRFLMAIGLDRKRDEVISISPTDPTAKVPFPVPTTYDTIVRYWLEVNGPVSRQVLGNLAGYAPTPKIKKELQELGKDKDLFHQKVTNQGYNLAGILLKLSSNKPWDVPFTFFVENLPSLQVRYYSISSSSAEDKDTISITAVVEREKLGANEVRGVATNYIHNIMTPSEKTYNLEGPRGIYKVDGGLFKVPVHVRRSNFKLPTKPEVPIIMVGPGTGVAPFRAFIRERAEQAESAEVGKALLFFGCRSKSQDAIYADEWPEFSSAKTAGKADGPFTRSDFLEVVNAYSRDEAKKVYVQNRMEEQSALISELLAKGAYFYVCGDASNMARSVLAKLVSILAKERGIPTTEAEDIVKKMKNRNLYQEDVW